jgi:hypothetical protein
MGEYGVFMSGYKVGLLDAGGNAPVRSVTAPAKGLRTTRMAGL